ncbi:MAG TPA: SCO family protein [Longimicrobiaceae bacterium]|nr:SCO family protein [Longimicrobiaceae bacterium]
MQRTDRRALALFLLVGALGLGGAGFLLAKRPPTFHGTTYTEVTPAPPFALTDHTGRRVTLDDYRGKVVLLFYGFTHCPDVCPTTLAKLARVAEGLGRRADDVQILLVTVDPERDTPAALGEYVRRFGPRAAGLTGDSAALAEAYRGYGVYTLEGGPHAAGHGSASGGHRSMTHSSVVYGIDRRGRLVVVIPPEADDRAVRDDVRALLRL